MKTLLCEGLACDWISTHDEGPIGAPAVVVDLAGGFVPGFGVGWVVALLSPVPGLAFASPPHHVFTPPCFEHAPCWVFALLNVASLHSAVAFFGAFAGFCASAEKLTAKTAAMSEVLTKR